jgi:AMP deaminase
MLDNIFLPLFEVSVDPTCDPALHHFLNLIVGFDCVDDESKHEVPVGAGLPKPQDWDGADAPPYYYWTYYLYANLAALNELRRRNGLTTFAFRPHAGEAGGLEHLAATFLCSDGINHGINLRKAPVLQYLYYLDQIPMALSPLSNNKLFVDLDKNPFFQFFTRGLFVSLSTDDPLLLHHTKEPLLEEYAVAAQTWKLSSVDTCEIARNSVLMSGFEHPFKHHYLGAEYWKSGPAGNDVYYTNVPNIRLQFRMEILNAERELVSTNAT